MLNKLLKYDLKWCYKALIIFYILSLVFASLTRLFFSINDSLIFYITGKITLGITISLLASILINNILRLWARFIKNLYGDEAYLTHTLPVYKKDLFLSKVLSSIITLFTSTIFIIAALLIMYYSKENIIVIKNMLSNINISTSLLIFLIAAIFYLEMLFIIIAGYISIILGYRQNNNKLIKSILFGLIIYFVLQAFIILIVFIIGLFNKDIMALFTSNKMTTDLLKQILIFSNVIYFIYNVILYIVGNQLFKKGVNID